MRFTYAGVIAFILGIVHVSAIPRLELDIGGNKKRAKDSSPICELGDPRLGVAVRDAPRWKWENKRAFYDNVSEVSVETISKAALLHDGHDQKPNVFQSNLGVRKRSLIPRAPDKNDEPKPLRKPEEFGRVRAGARDYDIRIREIQNKFILALKKDIPKDEGYIGINPSADQLAKWMFRDFSVTEQGVWRVQGLEGCTMSIILSSKGFWGGHLWESTGTIGGASTFNERFAKKDDEDPRIGIRPRELEVFKPIAIDIHDRRSPQEATSYTSLRDLKDRVEGKGGNLFPAPTDIHILIFTKSLTKENTGEQMYKDLINELVKGYNDALPGIPEKNIKFATYWGAEDVEGVSGTMTIQYTPYEKHSKDNVCDRTRLARVWVENNPIPALEVKWGDEDEKDEDK
ncbi:hypothetical protein B0J14DRAFT_678198 [Halenospora varia]|nr:hypothetical protein B0J14DRAFT_678198 [Halenospora varia]